MFAEEDGTIIVHWTERGGPSVAAPTGGLGFGGRAVADRGF